MLRITYFRLSCYTIAGSFYPLPGTEVCVLGRETASDLVYGTFDAYVS